MKRDSKIEYYKKFFENNKNKMSSIWKGIRTIVNINSKSKRDIKIINNKGVNPLKIAKLFNEHYVNVGLTIDKKIPKAIKKFQDYLSNIKIQKTFFLKPATPHEIFDLILSLGPNSIPIYILKINNNIFSEQLANIVNLSFYMYIPRSM